MSKSIKAGCNRDRKTLTVMNIGPELSLGGDFFGSNVDEILLRSAAPGHQPEFVPPLGLAPDLPRPARPSVPDFAFKIRDLLDRPCPAEDELQSIVEPFAESITQSWPSADVRVRCDKVDGEPSVLTVALWVLPSLNELSDLARQWGLAQINLLAAEDTFGFMMNSSLIYRNAGGDFNNLPKRWNHDNEPDPNGSVHLTGINVKFSSPDKIETSIFGYDDAPWPDISFTIKMVDRLAAGGAGGVSVVSDRDLDADTGWHILLALLSLPISIGLSGFFLYEAISGETADPPDRNGAGAAAAGQFPTLLRLSDELSLALDYKRLNVTKGGIFTGGTYVPGATIQSVFDLAKAGRVKHRYVSDSDT